MKRSKNRYQFSYLSKPQTGLDRDHFKIIEIRFDTQTGEHKKKTIKKRLTYSEAEAFIFDKENN